ncbi:unnamed protein product [Polarella glacialis]|uniref:RING-type E3 ubiquitin transferase n=1 Tax=Polarella glacialis TaxID=89957 RepID=A0A813JR37_POLGL|nr:unnamed protein product [Polarella glacialis]
MPGRASDLRAVPHETKARHDNCPSCRGPFPTEDMRNRGMEQLAENQYFECRWGCGSTQRPSELEEHCRNCQLRQVNCPVKDCPYRSSLRNLQQHLEVDLHDFTIECWSTCTILPFSTPFFDLENVAFWRGKDNKKIHLAKQEDMFVLIGHEFKNQMLTLSFSHFDHPLKYTLKLTGGRDRECIFTGRTKELDANEGGAQVWIPKELGADFRVNDFFPLTMSLEAV